jgi:exonuclease SbcC
MKILTIRLKNLASLEGEYTINFNEPPLKTAGIFAITGPTGAGKSTILDAICLALYADTPRFTGIRDAKLTLKDGLNEITQGDARNILRKGASQGYAQVEFKGTNGNVYQSTWMVNRAHNRASGKMQPDSLQLINLTSQQKISTQKTEVLKENERLTGLTFAQFTRTIMLAQGDFTAFIKADKNEKSALLEKLTGTEIYSRISIHIYNKTKEAENNLLLTQKETEHIRLLDIDELTRIEKEQNELKNTLDTLNQQKKQLEKELNWHNELQQLTKAANESEEKLQEAQLIKTSSQERISKHNLSNLVQPIRLAHQTMMATNTEKDQKEKQIAEEKTGLVEIQAKLSEALQNFEKAQAKERELKLAIEQITPQIHKARELDTRIEEKNLQLQSTEKDLINATKTRDNHKQKLEQKQTEANTIQREISKLEAWIKSNNYLETRTRNIDLTTSKLNDLTQLTLKQNKHSVLLQQTQTKLNQTEEVILQLEKTHKEISTQAEQLKQKHLELTQHYNPQEVTRIKTELDELQKQIQMLLEAKGCWQQIVNLTDSLKNIDYKKQQNEKSQVIHIENLKIQEEALRIAKIKMEQAEATLHRIRLETAENIEQIRSQLTEGDPCPVCGSMHHPYKTEVKPLVAVLSSLQHEAEATKAEWALLSQKTGGLKSTLESLSKENKNLITEKEFISLKIKPLTQTWNNLQISSKVHQLSEPDTTAWLDEDLKNALKLQETLSLKTIKDETLKQELDETSVKIGEIQHHLNAVEIQLSSSRESKNHLEPQLRDLKAEHLQLQAEYTLKIDEISQLIDWPEWIDHWKSQPDKFAINLQNDATRWNQAQETLSQSINNLQLLTKELEGLNQQLQQFTIIYNQLIAQHTAINNELNALKTERNNLLQGESIALVEERNSSALQNSAQEQIKLRELKDSLILDANSRLERLKIHQQNAEQCHQKVNQLSQEINNWLEQFNTYNNLTINQIQLNELLQITDIHRKAEEEWLQAIENNITKCKAAFMERKQILETHIGNRPSDQSVEALHLLLSTTQTDIDRNTEQFQRAMVLIKQNHDNQQLYAHKQKQINELKSVFENWEKLNTLIGSADGKKFREMAQGFTLDFLVAHANSQLGQLTSRYHIQRIPDSLALQVIDKDMGDEIRPIHTLSGGESFLVSLALALGLASFSSKNMNIESLFIDEGFGSLDPETLGVAMDALERLHNQGRKVGVISHVQEMTERIRTQIRVDKMANGKSTITIQ